MDHTAEVGFTLMTDAFSFGFVFGVGVIWTDFPSTCFHAEAAGLDTRVAAQPAFVLISTHKTAHPSHRRPSKPIMEKML
jgi:hypothetical protein